MTPVSIESIASSSSSSSSSSSATAQLGFATRAIHVGSEPSQETGAVIPPISLSTTFAQDGVGNFKGYEYSRSGNPNRTSFERAVASLEGAQHAFAFSSGSAVTATILAALPPQSHIVSVNDVYGGTYRYFNKVATVSQNIQTTFVDLEGESDNVATRLRAALRPDTRLVWVETPTNPTLRLVDIQHIVKVTREISPDARVVVDNTFLTPYYQQPLALGADIVVHSVTKYLNGHSDVVMGVALTNDNAWAEKIKFLQNGIGAVPSAFDSWLALRGLKTLSLRMRTHGESALRVAQFLESHPGVERVIYPGLTSHPSHALAARQIAKQRPHATTTATAAGETQSSEISAQTPFPYGGMVSFRLKKDPADESASDKFFSQLRIFTLAESLGGVESLCELPSKMTHASIDLADRIKLGIGHNLIRLSVGIEDVDDLIADLDRAVSNTVSA